MHPFIVHCLLKELLRGGMDISDYDYETKEGNTIGLKQLDNNLLNDITRDYNINDTFDDVNSIDELIHKVNIGY